LNKVTLFLFFLGHLLTRRDERKEKKKKKGKVAEDNRSKGNTLKVKG